MDGISRTAGVGPMVKIGGQHWTLTGRILRHYGEIEAEIIKHRGNPFELIRQAAEAFGDRVDLLDEAFNRAFEQARTWRNVGQVDFFDFLNTWRGTCMAVWLAMRHNKPGLTFDEVMGMIGDEVEDRQRAAAKEARDKAANEPLPEGYLEEEREVYARDVVVTARSKAQQDFLRELERAIDQATGEDELGNSTGSSPPPSDETNQSPPSEA